MPFSLKPNSGSVLEYTSLYRVDSESQNRWILLQQSKRLNDEHKLS